MLKNTKAFAGFAVDDIPKAKQFYADTLELDVTETPQGLQLHFGGGNDVFIYKPGKYVAPAHTVLNFMVDDAEKMVDEFATKGIKMEQYDLGNNMKTNEKGILVNTVGPQYGPKAIAWFKDPAGNILSIIQQK